MTRVGDKMVCLVGSGFETEAIIIVEVRFSDRRNSVHEVDISGFLHGKLFRHIPPL